MPENSPDTTLHYTTNILFIIFMVSVLFFGISSCKHGHSGGGGGGGPVYTPAPSGSDGSSGSGSGGGTTTATPATSGGSTTSTGTSTGTQPSNKRIVELELVQRAMYDRWLNSTSWSNCVALMGQFSATNPEPGAPMYWMPARSTDTVPEAYRDLWSIMSRYINCDAYEIQYNVVTRRDKRYFGFYAVNGKLLLFWYSATGPTYMETTATVSFEDFVAAMSLIGAWSATGINDDWWEQYGGRKAFLDNLEAIHPEYWEYW